MNYASKILYEIYIYNYFSYSIIIIIYNYVCNSYYYFF